MSKLEFVNVHGQVVNVDYLPRAQRVSAPALKRVTYPQKAKSHHGFEVVGLSQAALEAAEAAFHESRLNKGLQRMAFDREAWLNKTKPRRAIARVFHIPEAAEQAAGMLRAGGGWHRVQAVAILKG